MLRPPRHAVRHEDRARRADLAGYAAPRGGELEPVLATLARERILRPVAGVRRGRIARATRSSTTCSPMPCSPGGRHDPRVRSSGSARPRRGATAGSSASRWPRVLLAGAMAIVTIFAFTQRSEAERQSARARRETRSRGRRDQGRGARARRVGALAALVGSRAEPGALRQSCDSRSQLSGEGSAPACAGRIARAQNLQDRGAVSVVEFRGDRILVAGADGWARLYVAPHPRRQPRKLHHGAPITAGDISPSGKLILIGGKDGTVTVWSPKGRQPLQVLRVGRPERSAVFSADGKHVLTAAGGSARALARRRRRSVWTYPLGWPVTRAVLSHDGHLVAVIGNSPRRQCSSTSLPAGVVHIFDQGDFVKSVAFSPNDAYLVTGGRAHAVEDGRSATARVWDVRKHDRLSELKTATRKTSSRSPSAQADRRSRRAASTEPPGPGLWPGRRSQTFSGHAGAVNDVAFSPDATNLLTASSDRTVRVWKNTSSPDRWHFSQVTKEP